MVREVNTRTLRGEASRAHLRQFVAGDRDDKYAGITESTIERVGLAATWWSVFDQNGSWGGPLAQVSRTSQTLLQTSSPPLQFEFGRMVAGLSRQMCTGMSIGALSVPPSKTEARRCPMCLELHASRIGLAAGAEIGQFRCPDASITFRYADLHNDWQRDRAPFLITFEPFEMTDFRQDAISVLAISEREAMVTVGRELQSPGDIAGTTLLLRGHLDLAPWVLFGADPEAPQ